MSTHETLLPCPFCGGEATLFPGNSDTDKCVSCDDCEVVTDHYTREEAIAAWNRRSPPAAVPDGWILVPRDPTPDMLAAGMREKFKGPVAGDIYRAIISAAPAAPNGWQPIETAPKDGTEFLGFGGGVEGVQGIQVVRWCERVGCWETPEASLEDWDNQAEGYSRPTHWMPLPDAPTEAHD